MFERFGEAGFVTRPDFESVLDDPDFGGERTEVGLLVGALDLAVKEDAEVALGIEEGEEFFRGGV